MKNIFSYLYNRTKNQIRVSFERKIYFFVPLTSFRDLLSTSYENKPYIRIFDHLPPFKNEQLLYGIDYMTNHPRILQKFFFAGNKNIFN